MAVAVAVVVVVVVAVAVVVAVVTIIIITAIIVVIIIVIIFSAVNIVITIVTSYHIQHNTVIQTYEAEQLRGCQDIVTLYSSALTYDGHDPTPKNTLTLSPILTGTSDNFQSSICLVTSVHQFKRSILVCVFIRICKKMRVLCSLRYSTAALPCPALPCPVLSCPVLSCPVLSCPVLS
jgi:hypothetical protein